jgi:hypothetical protein
MNLRMSAHGRRLCPAVAVMDGACGRSGCGGVYRVPWPHVHVMDSLMAYRHMSDCLAVNARGSKSYSDLSDYLETNTRWQRLSDILFGLPRNMEPDCRGKTPDTMFI